MRVTKFVSARPGLNVLQLLPACACCTCHQTCHTPRYPLSLHCTTTVHLSRIGPASLPACLQGRFEAAIRDYTKAIELNPGHCRAYYNRAFSHDRLGQFKEAVDDYSRALQIEPANATALHNRGSLFERLGRCGGSARGRGWWGGVVAHVTLVFVWGGPACVCV